MQFDTNCEPDGDGLLLRMSQASLGCRDDARDEVLIRPARRCCLQAQVADAGILAGQRVDFENRRTVLAAGIQAEIDAGKIAAAQRLERVPGQRFERGLGRASSGAGQW